MKQSSLITLCGCAVLLVLSAGCQKEEIAGPDVKINIRTHDCDAVCIDPGAQVYYEHSGTVSEQFGNPSAPKFRTFNYDVYNTLTEFKVDWTQTGENGERQLNFSVSIPDLSWTDNAVTSCGNPTRNGTLSFVLPSGWEACMVVNFTATIEECTGNDKATSSGTYDLVGSCGCELDGNTFTGESTTDCGDGTHSAIYTLCSEDGIASFHLQGGLTNFTGEDGASVTWVGGNDVTSSQRTPGGSSNRIVEVDGSLAECSCIIVTMSWESTNENNEVTGSWSASGNGVDLNVDPLFCNE